MDMKLTPQRTLRILTDTGDLILREPEGTDAVYRQLYDAIWPESEMGPEDALLEEMGINHEVTRVGVETRVELTFEEVRAGTKRRWRVNARRNGYEWAWAPRTAEINSRRQPGTIRTRVSELALPVG